MAVVQHIELQYGTPSLSEREPTHCMKTILFSPSRRPKGPSLDPLSILSSSKGVTTSFKCPYPYSWTIDGSMGSEPIARTTVLAMIDPFPFSPTHSIDSFPSTCSIERTSELRPTLIRSFFLTLSRSSLRTTFAGTIEGARTSRSLSRPPRTSHLSTIWT